MNILFIFLLSPLFYNRFNYFTPEKLYPHGDFGEEWSGFTYIYLQVKFLFILDSKIGIRQEQLVFCSTVPETGFGTSSSFIFCFTDETSLIKYRAWGKRCSRDLDFTLRCWYTSMIMSAELELLFFTFQCFVGIAMFGKNWRVYEQKNKFTLPSEQTI